MPQYFFNIVKHTNTEDHEGADLADLGTAWIEAQKDILEIMSAQPAAHGAKWPQWSIEICDSKRKLLMVVPFPQNEDAPTDLPGAEIASMSRSAIR